MSLVECALRTDPGRDPDKQVNEDSAHHADTPFGYLAVVCDGMGGHEGGLEASSLAVRTIFEYLTRADLDLSRRDAMREAILEANRRVYALGARTQRARPGATVVALLVHDEGADLAHVGDSRIYLVHGGDVSQVTKDHSAVQLMVDAGVLTPEQALGHPDANVITRALGMAETVDVEVRPTSLAYSPSDVFVLCSDGLSDLASLADIHRVVAGAPPPQAAGQLVDLANARGGHDNITALLVRTNVASYRSEVTTTLVGMDQRTQPDTLFGEPAMAFNQETIVMAPQKNFPPPSAPVLGSGGRSHSPMMGAGAPPSVQPASTRNPQGPFLAAVLLALIAFAVAVTFIVLYVRERREHHHRGADHSSGVSVPMLDPPRASPGGSSSPAISATADPLVAPPVVRPDIQTPSAEVEPAPLPTLRPAKPARSAKGAHGE